MSMIRGEGGVGMCGRGCVWEGGVGGGVCGGVCGRDVHVRISDIFTEEWV